MARPWKLLLGAGALAQAAPPSYGVGSQNTITVNVAKKYQAFDGMGFSEAFQRGTQIYGADGLSAANTTRTLDLLFSNEVGAGLTILRNGIGSSVTNPYDLMKSIAPTSPGSNTSALNYDWEGTTLGRFGLDNGQMQLTKDALARGVKYVYADAWSAPGYMKSNSNDSYGGYLCGVTGVECATGDWRQAYADYLVQYLRFYEHEGIAIDYVGFLNEPDLNTTYASMQSDGQQAADFLEVLYPTLEASGLKTEIACCDGSGWEQARERLEGIEAAGADYTLGIATAHGYSSYPSTPFDVPQKVWETEWADLEGPHTLAWYYNGSSGEGLTWANNIHNTFTVSNVSAFLFWQGADNTTSNSALILLDGDTVNVSKRLWAMAQWSRFVKPGATRIDVQSSDAAFNTTAFENADGSVAVQVINNSNATQSVLVSGLKAAGHQHSSSKPTVRGHLTNNDHDLALSPVKPLGGGRHGANIPAYSMMSFVLST